MIQSLTNRFKGMTKRERVLVATALLLTLSLLLAYAVVLPLFSAIRGQAETYYAALDRRAVIEMKAGQLDELDGNRNVQPPPDMKAFLDMTAGETGFSMDIVEDRPDGGVRVSIASVNSATLMQWLHRLDEAGIAIKAAELQPSANGNVAFRGEFGEAG